MWMSLTKERNQISLMMVVLVVVIWSPVIYMSSLQENGEEDDEDIPGNPNLLYSRNKNPMASPSSSLRIEIVAILPDSSNTSLGLSKSLNRVLNSLSWEEFTANDDAHPASNNERRNITWRVKNFVIHSNESVVGSGDDDDGGGDHGRKWKKTQTPPSPVARNVTFSPQLVPKLCDFLAKTKAIAMIDLVGNLAGEQVLSLVSSAAVLPLIGSSQYANPLDTLRKDKDDFYISLSTSVRQVARALGRFLISCHWHSFTVLFDDTPAVLSSQMMWEEELSRMTTNQRFGPQDPANSSHHQTPSLPLEFYDYDQNPSEMNSGLDYEENGGNDNDPETSPMLKPHFLTMKIRSLNGALRALSQLTKQTQGIVVLLCSDRSLLQVFRAAQKLRMLNGDYVFILVGPHFQFEVIPEWVPSGVLALRGPRRAQIGKYTTKRTGKLLASALHSVKNSKIPVERKQGSRRNNGEKYFSSPLTSTSFTSGSIRDASSSSSGTGKSPSAIRIPFQVPESPRPWDEVPKFKTSSRIRSAPKTIQDLLHNFPNVSCWNTPPHPTRKEVSELLAREIRSQMEGSPQPSTNNNKRPLDFDRRSLTFDILNLVDIETGGEGTRREWVRVGNVSMDEVHVKTIRWPGGRIFGPGDRQLKSYRVVTTTAPPFVMDADSEDNRTCVIGLPCLKVNTTKNDELAVIFAEYEQGNLEGTSYKLACCDGLAMDLLASISRELKFEIDLFLVPDGYFGARLSDGSWNGLMDVLVTGSAHMSFAPFSVTSVRSTAVDFSTPFFFSAVGFLGMSKNQDVPLMAFLAPFSFELWAAIFLTLNMTALAVALFEWLSPFGLNPWGRQRTKNFSIASALWVVWGRLFSHLVAFKAPKSWPNKFLINVWGGFSVIFVASYTANIAALFAGKLSIYQRGVHVHDRSLLSQRVAAVRHSASQFYIKRENQQLWEHLQKFPVNGFQEGVNMLKNNTLDLLIGDGPLLDYYRGTDTLCNLIDVSNQDKIGDDTYAVAMTKGFPLKESISSLISKYVGNGYLDYLQGKWYGQLECFRRSSSDLIRARALGIDSVAGMIIMLGVGTLVGILILSMELIVYKFALPYFRRQPKGTIWRSPNIMFFSQKLYRFINCVELVSPHHAAKELVNTLRQGQITSLFQKSVKRKEREQRRRRKSKAQFFEMIQEIRRVQKHERQQSLQHQDSTETRFSTSPTSSSPAPIYSIQARLESNKQTPKVVRILGVDVDIASNSTFPTMSLHHSPSTILEVPEEQSDEDRDDNIETEISKKRRRLGRRGPEQRVEFKLEPDEIVRSLEGEQGENSASMNLNQLTKQQIIHLWKTSELQLKEQLRTLMREKDVLIEKVELFKRTKIP